MPDMSGESHVRRFVRCPRTQSSPGAMDLAVRARRRRLPHRRTALIVLTPGVAPAAAPPDHYANHPIRVRPNASASPIGLTPAQIKSAYDFTTDLSAGAGKIIAIVDAYDDPTAEADLNKFSMQYGLPACTTANKCFQKVNQTGGTRYPRADGGWALEISLDIQ